MKFQEAKAQAKSGEYAEFTRLDSFFTNPGSIYRVRPADEPEALRRYEQLHNIFFTR